MSGSIQNPNPGTLKAFLVLGRMSNLPTVWSNVLLAWSLSGSADRFQWIIFALAGSLLYTGGMLLNDYFDFGFDSQHRPERPIPAGWISLKAVGLSSLGMMVVGWGIFIFYGLISIIYATALTGCIILYNKWHKGNPLSPWIMAACRSLLILSVALAAGDTHAWIPESNILWTSIAAGSYIVGLTYIAKAESAPVKRNSAYWEAIILLALPWLITLMQSQGQFTLLFWISASLATAWTLWALAPVIGRKKVNIGKMVSALLAGIPLIDALVLSPYLQYHVIEHVNQPIIIVFMMMFSLACLTQLVAPAT